ncbi:hypothetical protein FEM48_Zijuj08G0065600 [Ziziphus jujuba var. spinosa]|uniref:Flavin-containing monooxygenase n=1 Tax=Ziziphus jujuba var. spinosa TaxID=714518 RepID=A0A978UXI9_ZIZJJ|nr:hypothetical protein FEM48_Zijuj08G0065600 [Ziziphus jujuba var. spinosa]
MEEVEVIIVGAGPAGVATSACLNRLKITNLVLEKEDCCGSLWKKRAYDRLKLHLAKQFCELPYMPYPQGTAKYIPRSGFIQYLDNYVKHFGISPRYHREVQSAFYDPKMEKWCVMAKNTTSNVQEVYCGKFLVVATGENSEGYIPKIRGLDTFKGDFMHSSLYENGKAFRGKEVLVIGSGNSGMEIAYDLTNHKTKTSICARSPVHVLTKEIVFIGMFLLTSGFPLLLVDIIVVILSMLRHGNLSKYGFQRPRKGPFYIKQITGRTPTIDVGCVDKIKTGEVKVFPSIEGIEGNQIKFENGMVNHFDAIIFATGYKSTVNYWLKDENIFFNENGMPKPKFPNHWKGENGLYSAGFSGRGLFGVSNDAQNIANDIFFALNKRKRRI